MVKRLVYDFDYLKYTIAAVCEKRDILVVHNKSGNEKVFKNRTAFYGHYLKKEGGWLGDLNKKRLEQCKEPFLVGDFTITDRQTPEPVSFMCQTVKNAIRKVNDAVGATSYYGYIGKGDSWRVGASTLMEYKGNRKDTIKPLMIGEIEEYILKGHNAEIVRHLEADDMVVVDAVKNPSLVLVGIDKDYYGSEPITLFNPDKMDEPFRIEGLGKLYIDGKDVRGWGRKFFYYQVLSGDPSDNYKSNSASDIEYGSKSAYKALVDCADDKACWEAIIRDYKKMYPEPKMFKGWRGDLFMVDWVYALKENCAMAYMLRTVDDKFNLEEVLERYDVK